MILETSLSIFLVNQNDSYNSVILVAFPSTEYKGKTNKVSSIDVRYINNKNELQ